MLPRSSGTFSPNPSTGLNTGLGHSTQGVLNASSSAGASPNTSSPIGNYGLSKIAVAQVSVLLSTLKTKQDDPAEFEQKVNKLKKLINDHGMEVISKYVKGLVLASAPQIFPGISRPTGSNGNGAYELLQVEMAKVSREIEQATMISESIETGSEDIFRDFDLSTFMEHFRLNALEKTILALAFKMGNRSDLKTKADAILSTNFPAFINIIFQPTQPDAEAGDISPQFLAMIVDRLIQYHPPNFTPAALRELASRIESRYALAHTATPLEILAALDLYRVLVDNPLNALVLHIQRTGADFTRSEDACAKLLQHRDIDEEQFSNALWYTTLSQNPVFDPSVLVAAARRVVPAGFRWQDVITHLDQPTARISPPQFLRLYRALLPVALQDGPTFDIQRLYSGVWANSDAQLSFIYAFYSLKHEDLDATTIPGMRPSFSSAEYAQSSSKFQELAQLREKHPMVSLDAMSAVFEVALNSQQATTSVEAKRLFHEDVVRDNIVTFFISALGVSKPWSSTATDTVGQLLDQFFFSPVLSPEHEFALDYVWRKDKDFVKQRLTDRHGDTARDLPLYFARLEQLGWLDEFTHEFNGFGLDLVTYGHGEGRIDLEQWLGDHADRKAELASSLLQFLAIKAKYEVDARRNNIPRDQLSMSPLRVKTVFSVLNVLVGLLAPDAPAWINCQRNCMIAYPRVINYGGDYDDVIDACGMDGHQVHPDAEARMALHFKAMYNDDGTVKDIVQALFQYKHSRNPLDQDSFSCIIYGLFEEYQHYHTYPLPALATTAVLFGGVLSRRLIDGIPLNVGLGMVLESIRDYPPDDNMYKFGLQALLQLRGRLPEWPSYCRQLVRITSLQGTETGIWHEAENVVNADDMTLRGGLDGHTNGNATAAVEPQYTPFTSVHVDPSSPGIEFEEPGDDDQDKIQFALNNIDQSSLRTRFDAIRDAVAQRHQQWFAIHLVEERAKMQPNLHQMYLELVKLFEDNVLWAEIQKATLACLHQIINSESTVNNSTERAHLKNLGGWLGMLTLARDKPIRHQNIAFKQLLLEAYDTKRLVVVIPFVCKVLDQGKSSTVFRPPNPWLMDILHLLIELYHHAEIKLNQKFEIEVLCKNLNLDHKNIKQSEDFRKHIIQDELPQAPPVGEHDSFDMPSMNGLGQIGSQLMPQTPEIPDLRANLVIPPTNEMVVSNNHLRDLVDKALRQALNDIIQPVVDRSVTIAAISTQQMIHKDFATEPDENRVRNCAINMVKATAGSLALVTSKEPLRANFTNQMRQLSSNGDIPGGLPEGTIIMCVNSNLDLASGVIENAAEKRAIPEIEELIESELEARRRYRNTRPGSTFAEPGTLSRWAMTMPDPYKLGASSTGLNLDQMAIYEEFARQPRPVATTTPSHIASTSDATRSIANEVLSDQYSSVPGIPTPAETPSLPSVTGHVQDYSHGHAGLINGRQPPANAASIHEPVHYQRKMKKMIEDLKHAATEAPEEHFNELPYEHQIKDIMDGFSQLIINQRAMSDGYATETTEAICEVLLGPIDDNLTLETFAKILKNLCRIGGPQVSDFAKNFFQRQEASGNFLRLHLIREFVTSGILDWRTIDAALARHIRLKDDAAMQLLTEIVQMTIASGSPMCLYADLGNSVESAYSWILDDAEGSRGQVLKSLLENVRDQRVSGSGPVDPEQMEHVFEEWVTRYRNTALTEKVARTFIKQLQDCGFLLTKDDFFLFVRTALDQSVAHYEQALHAGIAIDDAYVYVDALARLIVNFVKWGGVEDTLSPVDLLESIWALVTMLVNLYTVRQAEFHQRIFFRFFSDLIFESKAYLEGQERSLWPEMLLRIGGRLHALGPGLLPDFVYGWMGLIAHRGFLSDILRLTGEAGWAAYTQLVKQMLRFLGEALKPIELDNVATKLYEAAAKMLIVLQHDFPEYLAAEAAAILPSIPPHCVQLINMVLMVGAPSSKAPDPFSAPTDAAGTQDLMSREAENPVAYLRSSGLLDILGAALENGPSENAVAHMTHAISRPEGMTSFAHAPIGANIAVIDALTAYIGHRAGQEAFDPSSPAVATLSMLLHELTAEARHYLILSMVNHLRSASPNTMFFSKFILNLFEQNLSDPEEMEILEQITRVLLERTIGLWPQPWGLLTTLRELVQSDKYSFCDLPFIKAAPDVRAALQQRALMG